MFSIESGVLEFKKSPDFEDVKDSDDNNVYEVTIRSTDAEDNTGTKDVMVRVTNEDEPGTLEFSAPQPQSGVELTVTLDDDDGSFSRDRYQWATGSSLTGSFTDITESAISTMYTPLDGDANKYIRVTANYTDGHGADKMAMATLSRAIRPGRTQNDAPEFPDDDADTAGNQTTRNVPENSDKGHPVGPPVTAQDDDSGDVLTYTLGGADASTFEIDPATGQITVEGDLDQETNASNVVWVRATDPSGFPDVPAAQDECDDLEHCDLITVTITIEGADDKPVVTAQGPVFTHIENTAALTITEELAVTDEDSQDDLAGVIWSLSGADASLFSINDATILTITKSPNYEAPKDANRDNVYEVGVVATVGGKASDAMEVTVEVIDADDEGKIKLSQRVPKVNVPVTATLSEEDEIKEIVRWNWYRSEENTCPETVIAYNVDTVPATDWGTAIAGADVATYVPDNDASGKCLLAHATYHDSTTNATDPTDRHDVYMQSDDVTIAADPGAPTFVPPGSTPGEPVTFKVPENSGEATTVGVVKARNDDGSFNYTLKDGTDATSFAIDRGTATITVKDGAELDYETKTTYRVTVVVQDADLDKAETPVTIIVTDVNEAPEITRGGIAVSGMASVMHEENSGREVATYMASGPPQGASVTWSLSGTDRGDFSISGGTLSFRSDPNYEAPADSGGDNEYMVTVKASYMTHMDEIDVTVEVTNVDEDGSVRVRPTTARVGSQLTATLTDPDGATATESWDWWVDDASNGLFTEQIAGESTRMYTPMAADAGRYLKARVTYSDGPFGQQIEPSGAIMVMAPDALKDRFDGDNDGSINRAEIDMAIDRFLGLTTDGAALSRADIDHLIDLFLGLA